MHAYFSKMCSILKKLKIILNTNDNCSISIYSMFTNNFIAKCFNQISNQEETLIETPRWPYEEEELLSYIDNEELPVVLLDLLESEHSSLFYSGCIIAQIRDYRQAYPSFLCDTHHVLLRPTNQVILKKSL